MINLEILSGKETIPSAVATVIEEGVEEIKIGSDAVHENPKDFAVSFKKAPSLMTTAERDRMKKFMKKVYESILAQRNLPNHVVYIAYPSDEKVWTNDEADAYLRIAIEAGLPVAGIVKESMAAYFRARIQPAANLDRALSEGVLIVDYGSSTIDFTYIKKGDRLKNTIVVNGGSQLGAGRVETLLLKDAMENPGEDKNMQAFANQYGNDKESAPYNQMLFQFRKAKEDYFGEGYSFRVMIDYNFVTASEQQQLDGCSIITRMASDVDNILAPYIQELRREIELFKNQSLKDDNGNDLPVAKIILTGGASRMGFVRKVFSEAFHLSEEHCTPGLTKPQFIVSEGVASLANAQLKTAVLRADNMDGIRQRINQFDWESELGAIIRKNVMNHIVSTVSEVMKDWRDGRIYEFVDGGKRFTINSLVRKLQQEFEAMSTYDFASGCKELIEADVLSEIKHKINRIKSEYNYRIDIFKEHSFTLPKSLTANVSKDGTDVLCRRFTDDNGIIYNAVDARYSGTIIMGSINMTKDRSESARENHYNYYQEHYPAIFRKNDPVPHSDKYLMPITPIGVAVTVAIKLLEALKKQGIQGSWGEFMADYVTVKGIKEAREYTQSYVDECLDELVRYATLSVFFN